MSQTFRNAEMVLIEAPTLYHEQEEQEEDEMVHALQMPRSTRWTEAVSEKLRFIYSCHTQIQLMDVKHSKMILKYIKALELSEENVKSIEAVLKPRGSDITQKNEKRYSQALSESEDFAITN